MNVPLNVNSVKNFVRLASGNPTDTQNPIATASQLADCINTHILAGLIASNTIGGVERLTVDNFKNYSFNGTQINHLLAKLILEDFFTYLGSRIQPSLQNNNNPTNWLRGTFNHYFENVDRYFANNHDAPREPMIEVDDVHPNPNSDDENWAEWLEEHNTAEAVQSSIHNVPPEAAAVPPDLKLTQEAIDNFITTAIRVGVDNNEQVDMNAVSAEQFVAGINNWVLVPIFNMYREILENSGGRLMDVADWPDWNSKVTLTRVQAQDALITVLNNLVAFNKGRNINSFIEQFNSFFKSVHNTNLDHKTDKRFFTNNSIQNFMKTIDAPTQNMEVSSVELRDGINTWILTPILTILRDQKVYRFEDEVTNPMEVARLRPKRLADDVQTLPSALHYPTQQEINSELWRYMNPTVALEAEAPDVSSLTTEAVFNCLLVYINFINPYLSMIDIKTQINQASTKGVPAQKVFINRDYIVHQFMSNFGNGPQAYRVDPLMELPTPPPLRAPGFFMNHGFLTDRIGITSEMIDEDNLAFARRYIDPIVGPDMNANIPGSLIPDNLPIIDGTLTGFDFMDKASTSDYYPTINDFVKSNTDGSVVLNACIPNDAGGFDSYITLWDKLELKKVLDENVVYPCEEAGTMAHINRDLPLYNLSMIVLPPAGVKFNQMNVYFQTMKNLLNQNGNIFINIFETKKMYPSIAGYKAAYGLLDDLTSVLHCARFNPEYIWYPVIAKTINVNPPINAGSKKNKHNTKKRKTQHKRNTKKRVKRNTKSKRNKHNTKKRVKRNKRNTKKA